MTPEVNLPPEDVTADRKGLILYTDKLCKRNRYMVDQADVLIAVWDGSPSGTGKTVRYAHQQGKSVTVIDPVSLDVTQE